MDDLISRAAAIAWFFRPYSNEEYYSNLDVERALKAVPAVDAAPVVHGYWMDEEGNAVGWDNINDCCPKRSCWCSACGDWLTGSDEYATTGNYCPNCGAKMDGERKEDE